MKAIFLAYKRPYLPYFATYFSVNHALHNQHQVDLTATRNVQRASRAYLITLIPKQHVFHLKHHHNPTYYQRRVGHHFVATSLVLVFYPQITPSDAPCMTNPTLSPHPATRLTAIQGSTTQYPF